LSRDNSIDPDGLELPDAWDNARFGFRLDWSETEKNDYHLQGDFYKGEYGFTYGFPASDDPASAVIETKNVGAGGNILAGWKHFISETSILSLQLYYDRASQKDSLVHYDRTT